MWGVLMSYEERVLNGVLCWRSTPNGVWVAYTLEQLTQRLMELRAQVAQDSIIGALSGGNDDYA